MQSQISSPPRTSSGDINIEENERHTPEISEMIATPEVKKQNHEDIEKIRSEIISQIKKNQRF